MKKAFLYAYDKANLGDDLFIRTITQRYPNVQFYMRGDRRTAERFATEPNLKILTDDRWLIRCAQGLRPSFAARVKGYEEWRCDAVVYIGGSLFIEYENWPTILTWWRYEAENRPFFVLGANFGPWHTEEYRRQMGEIFSKMRDVCFRDQYSKALFPDVETVRCAPDILLGYPMPEVAIKEKQAFFSVIDCAAKDEGDNHLAQFDARYVAFMAQIADKLADDGWRVIFSSFCREEGDEEGIRKVIKAMKYAANADIVCYNGKNGDELLRMMAESETIVASRFHAAILGFAAQRPVIPVIYSDKTGHLLEDLHFAGEWIDIRGINADAVDTTISAIKLPEKQTLQGISELQRRAAEHFQKLDMRLAE